MNVNPLHPLRAEEVYELAGCILTSSTVERYVRCLENSKAVHRLQSELQMAQLDGAELLAYGWLYRSYVLEALSRSEMEISLAAIMYVLGRSGIVNVDDLLLACLVSQRPQMAWLAGLARILLGQRSSSSVMKARNTRILRGAVYRVARSHSGGGDAARTRGFSGWNGSTARARTEVA